MGEEPDKFYSKSIKPLIPAVYSKFTEPDFYP
jgi:hypothetical protein